MKRYVQRVLYACAPAFAVCFAIAVLHAAQIDFPLPLSAAAWPHWLIFMVLVQTSTSFLFYCIGRGIGSDSSKET